MDLRYKFTKEIIIKIQGMQHYQYLDYVGMLFHCARCHVYGHVARYCALKFKRKFLRRKSTETSSPVEELCVNRSMEEDGIVEKVGEGSSL